MKTDYTIRGRELPYAIILLLFVLPFTAQELRAPTNFEKYLQQAKQDTFSLRARKRFLNIAYNNMIRMDDSVAYSRYSDIVEVAILIEDSVLFHKLAREGYKLAQRLGKPNKLGDAHWNYASYYLRNQEYDSSYYHYNQAYLKFTAGKRDYYAGKMLYNMAYIASEMQDLTGAEILLFRSIKIFERLQKPQQLYRSYNILGNNADDLEEFEKSLIYYQKAAQFIPSFKNEFYYRLENWNNLGVRFYKMKLFEEAEALFDRGLQHREVLKNYPILHARLLDNRAYCRVSLGQLTHVSSDMYYAQQLRDSLGETSGSVLSRLRFANYYGKIGDSLQGISMAKEALQMAHSSYLTPHVLEALELLAALDKANSIHYLRQHIALDKIIDARDRKLRNKFTAIQYETAKYIAENERLFQQRLWISLGAVIITILLILTYLNARQRAKTKALLFEREQQQYNEDMFLMALKQKTNLEKGKSEERQRISQELHDGIVSRLFTLRFRWHSVKLVGEGEMLFLHGQFLEKLELLERDIRNLSHELRNVVFFEAVSFLDTLGKLIGEQGVVGNFSNHFECTNPMDWENLSYSAKINLQRIFEEALHNVVKHAHAKEVRVYMCREGNDLQLTITDNGRGFETGQVKKGMGIKNIENRSQKLDAKFELHSSLGSGARLAIQIPFKKNIQ